MNRQYHSHFKPALWKLVGLISMITLVLGAGLAWPTKSSARPSFSIYDYNDPLCDSTARTHVWVGPWYTDGAVDGVPLYWPLHYPVAATLSDAVAIRFQYWSDNPGNTTVSVHYRITAAEAYDPNAPFDGMIVPQEIGVVGQHNNKLMEAVIPSMRSLGIRSSARVDYYIEAVNGANRCETVGENPFDDDRINGVEHHIYSYVASKKETGRIYQLFVRNFGAQPENDDWESGHAPISGYQNSGTFCDVTDEMLDSIKNMSFDYIWLSGVVHFDNQSDQRKGDAGSPYAVSNYYRASPDLACAAEGSHRYDQSTHGDDATDRATRDLLALIDRIHAHGLKVMIDLVPNHTSTVYEEGVVDRVYPWEPQPFQLAHDNYQYDYEQQNVRINGDSRLVFPGSGNDWTDTYRIDYTNDRTAFRQTDPVTGGPIKAGNGCNNANLSGGCAQDTPYTSYQILDRVIETWMARGVDGFRVDFPHVLPDDLWSYVLYNAKTRAAGSDRHAANGARYPEEVFIIGEGYDRDGSFGPDSGAIGNAGSNWANLWSGGFDGVYDKAMYDQIRSIYTSDWSAEGIGEKFGQEVGQPWSYIQKEGNIGPTAARHMVHMLSNHDELQPASNEFLGGDWGADNILLPKPGTATAFLLPGSLLMYNGHEVGEQASVEDNYQCGVAHPSPWCGAKGDGKTTFFDYAFMPELYTWVQGESNDKTLALRSYYQRIIEQARYAQLNDPQGAGYFDISQTSEWDWQPEFLKQWVYPFARTGETIFDYKVGSIILSNFYGTPNTINLSLKINGGNELLTALGIDNDPSQTYRFYERAVLEDEDGNPLPESDLHIDVNGADLYAGNTLSLSVPRWTTRILKVYEYCPITEAAEAARNHLPPQQQDDAQIEGTLAALRHFRDKVLKQTSSGQALVDLYYKYSPNMIAVIVKNPSLGVTSWDVLEWATPSLIRYLDGAYDKEDLLTKDRYYQVEDLYYSFSKQADPSLRSQMSYFWNKLALWKYINAPMDSLVSSAVEQFVGKK